MPGVRSTIRGPHPELSKRIGMLTAKHRTRAFLVGGPVRDILLGRPSPDLDVAVESRCRQIGTELARELGGRFVYHARFLTGSVLLADCDLAPRTPYLAPPHVDIAQTRTETYSRPAVLPAVRPAGIEEDLARRDFSVNAIACELTPRGLGRVIDPLGGRADLARRVIRVLHDRSFVDDPTRAFRAIRFAVRLGFEIEPRTLGLMRASIAAGHPRLLTPERILYELRLICAEPLAARIFEALLKEGLLAACFGPSFVVHPPSFIRSLHRLALRHAPPALLYLFVLSRLPLTDRFPITRAERDSVRALATFDELRPRLARARRPSAVFGLLRPIPEPALQLLALLETGPVAGAVGRFLGDYSRARLAIAGPDLRALGLRPGPDYRRILDAVLAARLDGRVTDAAGELALARRLARRRKGTSCSRLT